MATCINSSRSCLPPFYTIPIFPLLNRKIFHLLVFFLYFLLHTAYISCCLRNILPGAIYCWLHTCVYVVLSELCYPCTPTFIATIANIGICIHFKERLPEGICCCLQTCNGDVLLVMYRMYIPALIVSSPDISQLLVYLCY